MSVNVEGPREPDFADAPRLLSKVHWCVKIAFQANTITMTDGIKLRTFLLICICITLSACQSEVATDELVTPTLSTDHEQPASLVTTVSEETVPSVTTTNLEQPFPSVNTEESSGDGVNLNQGTKFPMFNANCAMDEPQRPLQGYYC